MKRSDIYWRRYKKHCTQDNDASFPFKVGTLGPHTVLPISISCLSCFPESHWWSEISSLSKVILVFRKARSHRAPNLSCKGVESPRWFNALPKNSAWDMIYEQTHCCDKAANHQLPIAIASWITRVVSVQESSSWTQNAMQICFSTRSVILNVMATRYTYLLNKVYCPHWLVQWSYRYSYTCILVHSP